MLFDRAVAWLITNKVLLPGATVLERQVARIRNRAQARVWSLLVQGISAETTAKLEALLCIADGGHVSMLDRLRKGPFLRSAPELVRAFRRIDAVRELGINLSVSSRIPPTRIQALARFATTAKASAVERLPDERRVATLVAFILNLEAIALDDALDLLDILITDVFSEAKNAGERARLRRIKDLDAAAIELSKVCRLILDPNVPDVALRETVFASVAQEDLAAAVDQVDHLVRPPEDIYYQELCDSFRRVRTFARSATNGAFRRDPCGSAGSGCSGVSSQSRRKRPCSGGGILLGKSLWGCGADIFPKATVNLIANDVHNRCRGAARVMQICQGIRQTWT
jgi:hypothetical protein